MKKISILSLCIAALMFTACNSGTNTNNNGDSTLLGNSNDTSSGLFGNNNNNSNSDNDGMNFAEDAAKGGLLEVELGKIAVEKATRQDVKDFGQKMVDDHTKANNELLSIVQSKNMTIPTDLDNSQRNDIKDLTDKTGADFDKAYVNKMVDDHKNDIDKYQKASTNLQDTALRNFALKTLPVLQEHYSTIQRIQDQIK